MQWIKSGIENPSKPELIGRCGEDEKNEWPRRSDKSRTLKKCKRGFEHFEHTEPRHSSCVCRKQTKVNAYVLKTAAKLWLSEVSNVC